MKKLRLTKLFLAEIEMNPNVAIACKRVGLSRQTVYRWRNSDQAFREAWDVAMYLGIESVLDLAESKLATNVAGGNQRAIEVALSYYGKRSDRNKYKDQTISMQRFKTLAEVIKAASEAK